MKDLTNDFLAFYHPQAALLFYRRAGDSDEMYVESYDIDRNGRPINAHPLSVLEADKLAKALQLGQKVETTLKPKGVLGTNILYTDQFNGKVIWFTKSGKRQVYFSDILGIPNGMASVPPMIWCADREKLSVFALGSDRRPTDRTKLYHAPYFNLDFNGVVCMGTVNIDLQEVDTIEQFTAVWENYFFNSYFTHLLGGHNPVDGNCVLLWEELVKGQDSFPMEKLKQSGIILQNLMQ